MSYHLEELTLKNDSHEEQVRTRAIFEDLKGKAQNGEVILEREKQFLCTCLKLTDIEDDGNLEDFDACYDFIFKELYLTYFSSALRAGAFYKAHKGKIHIVTEKEKVKDFKYLQTVSDKWLKEIEKTNHTDQILQTLASETRTELKNHKKSAGKLFFRKQKENYSLQREKLILHSKFIYLLVKQVIENNDPDDFVFDFIDQRVEIDSFSLIHIINRHYAEIIKNNPQKTYHIEDFEPDSLHTRLKDILSRINSKDFLQSSEIEKIAFVFKNITYRVWIKKRVKHLKREGAVDFLRVETFYPIEDDSELKDLSENYEPKEVDNELNVFVKKDKDERS